MLEYRETSPTPPLRDYLECFWTIETDLSLDQELCLPDGSASFVFNFGPEYYRKTTDDGAEWQLISRASLAHQGKGCVLISQKKPVRILGVRFKPYGLSAFFKISMSDFSPPFVLQKDSLTPFIMDLEPLLWPSDTFPERIASVEAALLYRLPDAAQPDELVKEAVAEMMRNGGNLKISDLLDTLCVSKSGLEKRFQDAVGLPPKILCNILRFNSIVYEQMQQPSPSLTELTYNQGFFDQSHLVHNFKSFTGVPPGKFFRQDNRLLEMLRQSFEGRVRLLDG